MSGFESAVSACVIQVTIVAAAALAATWLLSRRQPAAAAAAAGASAVTILAATLLAPAPLPSLDNWLQADARDNRPAASREAPTFSGDDANVPAGIVVDAGALMQRTWRAWNSQLRVGERIVSPRTRTGVVMVLAAGAVVGLARRCRAWRYAAVLRHRARPVSDAALGELFEDLRRRLERRHAWN